MIEHVVSSKEKDSLSGAVYNVSSNNIETDFTLTVRCPTGIIISWHYFKPVGAYYDNTRYHSGNARTKN